MSSQPTVPVIRPELFGSMFHVYVYLTSSMVSGWPSDQLRPGVSSRSISKPVSLAGLGDAPLSGVHLATSAPLVSRTVLSPNFGILAASCGFQCPSEVVTQSACMLSARTSWIAPELL